MTERQQQLKDEIWPIWKILIDAKETFHYCNYLHNPETDEELQYLNSSQDFHFIRTRLWRLTVIELAKLLRENDRYSIHRIIKKLKQGGHFGDLGVNPLKIEQWENSIERSKINIDKLILLRDKVYAHTDSDPAAERHNLTFRIIEDIIEIISSVIRDTYMDAFEAQALVEDSVIFDKRRFNIIKILAKERNDRIKAMTEAHGLIIKQA